MREDGGCSEDRPGRMRPCCLEVKEMVKEGDMEVDDERTKAGPCRYGDFSMGIMPGHAIYSQGRR